MGKGTHRFRVAFVLGPEGGEYHNIDDGIYGEFMALGWEGTTLQGRTSGGGIVTLPAAQGRESLTGTFTQGPGADAKQSLVGENQTYPVTLWWGEDYLHPRLGPQGPEQPHYDYVSPRPMPDGWLTGDFGQCGADIPKVEGAVRDILKGKFPYIHSLLVVKDSKLVLEEYFYGYTPNDAHPVMSATKDIFSLLFGIGQGRGLFQPRQKLYDFFPSYRSRSGWDTAKDRITLEDLLTMTSGLGCDDFKDSDSCSWKMFPLPDWLDFSLALPLGNPPGSHFAYCGACLCPLTAVLEKQSGLPVTTFAQKYLFDPLGIQPSDWWDGPHGFHSPAFGLALKPRDMAKIGLLVLRKGNWNGQQVVPEKWIEESTSLHVPASKTGKKADYGYLWWERDVPQHGKKLRVLDAWGVGGQHIFIVPALDLVCVMTGGNYKDGRLGGNSFKILHEVLEALR